MNGNGSKRREASALVLGGSGMLGHKVAQELSARMPTVATSRGPLPDGLSPGATKIERVDVSSFDTVRRLIQEQRPRVVINCVGIIKQSPAGKDPIPSIEINSLFPHRLFEASQSVGARVIHVSTDCVFSGERGMYREDDFPDARDLYGRSKLLGEIDREGALTLRTSIVGRELSSTTGLIEWFLSNRGGEVKGYADAVFSGLTTRELARVIARIVERHASLSGLYHVSAEPISKLDLLELLNRECEAGVKIHPSSEVRIDRSLDSSRFRAATGWAPPSWREMIRDMAADPTPYEQWRRSLEPGR